MIDNYSVIHYTYQSFYRKIYKNDEYLFNPSENVLKLIDQFFIVLDENYNLECIGLNTIISYFVFQFSYWLNCDIKEKKNWSDRIQMSYIIGPKAFGRWLIRDKNFDWLTQQAKFLEQYKINTQDIKDFFKEVEEVKINFAEETEKKRWHNTDQGFVNCIMNTTLYSHLSPLCVTCIHKKECKQLQKNNYQELYNKRQLNNSQKIVHANIN